jgi:hypothetical protein
MLIFGKKTIACTHINLKNKQSMLSQRNLRVKLEKELHLAKRATTNVHARNLLDLCVCALNFGILSLRL